MKHEINSNRVLMSSLALCLVLVSANLLAQESLVKGASTTTNDTITGTAPNQLVSTTVTLPLNSGTWQCMVTGSAEAINPLNGDDNRYVFGFSEGPALPAATQSGGDRTIDKDNLTGEETDRTVVSSTLVIRSLSSSIGQNAHTFYWSARKENGLDADMIVEDSSMGVFCSDFE